MFFLCVCGGGGEKGCYLKNNQLQKISPINTIYNYLNHFEFNFRNFEC